MSEYKSLSDEKAVKKLRELVEHITICLFCTELTELPVNTRPMGVQEVDDEGNLWFISSSDSNKNFEIKDDNRVQLFFSNTGDSEYFSVYGNATVFRDQEKIDELWNPIAKAWFEKGKEDPKVTLIKVEPSHIYYWDTKYGKLVSFFNIAVAAVTGTNRDTGLEGELKV